MSEQFNCSVRSIQRATASNHKKKTFTKVYNFVLHTSGTKQQVDMARAELFSNHGISTPKPKRHVDGSWSLLLNAPNSYISDLVLSGVKGYKAQPTISKKTKKANNEDYKFIPSSDVLGCGHYEFIGVKSSRYKKLKVGRKGFKGCQYHVFNEKKYDIGNYILDNSFVFEA